MTVTTTNILSAGKGVILSIFTFDYMKYAFGRLTGWTEVHGI